VRLSVGCAMWAHKPWVGRHLPAPRGREGLLPAYATWCNAVEGNATFYAPPSATTVAGWAEQAPEDFRFVFKLPRAITHERRLRGATDELAAFFDVLAPLGARVGALAIQLPGSFGPPNLGALAAFVTTLPSAHRFAVEVRHPAFFDGSPASRALEDVLERRGVEWIPFDTTTMFAAPPTSEAERDAWSNKPRVPRRTTAVTDHPIVRYLGRDDPDATVAGWQSWLPVVAGWLAEGRSPTVFVHTPDNADAPVLARRFHAEVARLVPGLDPLPEPLTPTPATLF
jgi:uncharacterized protein YecE (DUF72 family)